MDRRITRGVPAGVAELIAACRRFALDALGRGVLQFRAGRLIDFVTRRECQNHYSLRLQEDQYDYCRYIGFQPFARRALARGGRAERPLQAVGAITAYAARMAAAVGFKALYLSGGGVAANSLGVPDLGISTMDDVLTDIRRITDACDLPLLVDADTGWGGAFNIARTVKSFIKFGAAGLHIEDQVQAKRCGHRPGKEIVLQAGNGRSRQERRGCAHRRRFRDHGAHRCAGGRGHRAGASSARSPASRPAPT